MGFSYLVQNGKIGMLCLLLFSKDFILAHQIKHILGQTKPSSKI